MFTWVLAGTLAVAAPSPNPEQKPVEPPAGVWRVQLMVWDGLTMQLKGGTVRIDGRSFIFAMMGGEVTGRAHFFVFEGKPRVDIESADGVVRGIWRLKGNCLSICTAAEGDARPTVFESPSGSRQTLWTLVRSKK